MNLSRVKAVLKKNRILRSAVSFGSINSTNQYLKENDFSSGTIAVSGTQTHGRGKHGAAWDSAPGGLWFSYVINGKIKDPYIFVILSSVAVCEALLELGINPVIKWPNDILAGGKKICGMLIENDPYNSKLVTGIGINVNNRVPAGAGVNAVSLKELLGKKHDIEGLFISVIKRIDSYINALPGKKKKLIASWIKFQGAIEGKQIMVNKGGKKNAFRVVKTMNNGSLKVKDSSGKQRLLSGEIFFI
jgi:BirA family biotin operon repressor/biotin-[acetyl-CoA-carboxylase] ligase